MISSFKYPLVENPYEPDDIKSGISILKSSFITMGKKTLEFEKKFTNKLKTKYTLMVNSGSSANLLIFQCLTNPMKKKRLYPGDEVILPTLCWSTSLWPIIQSNLKPVFVDINFETLNICEKKIEEKITKKTKAIMLVHVLGNSCDMSKILNLKKKYKLQIIEDTCESLGSKFKQSYLGSIGDFSSFSFYSSHQISSGEGGMVTCRTLEDYEIMKSLRSHGWSRGLKNEKKIAKENKNLDKKFIFVNSGFNLRPTDVSAAIGLSQFKKLNKFIKIRSQNRDRIKKYFDNEKILKNNIKIVNESKYVTPSWFGISLIIINKKLNKFRLISNLEKNGIETRPIISGNFADQPSIKLYNIKHDKYFPNAENIYNSGFFIGLPFRKIPKKKINNLIKIFMNCIQTSIEK